MDAEKKKFELEKKDNEIIYSRAIKAGKRIYYLDVKKSKNDDLFVAITESKKKVTGFDEDAQVTYEKHKIFLYKEDFEKFTDGLEDVINFIRREQKSASDTEEENMSEKVDEKEDKDDSQSDNESAKTKGFFGKFKF
jgi:hypothetical protein